MSDLEGFVQFPCEETLDGFTKEQLLRLAEHYEVEITDKRLKETVKSILKANLEEMGVLEDYPVTKKKSAEVVSQDKLPTSQVFTFEQQKELLMLQSEQERLKLEQELQMERLRVEQSRLEIERSKLELIKEGKLTAVEAGVSGSMAAASGSRHQEFDIFRNLSLVPKFNERDPETFFSMFERVAEVRNWPESARTLMLQCVLTGRAQEAYSCLSPVDSQKYTVVKAAVLKAFELVPEAYRKRFRTWRKMENKTYLEFARDLSCYFARWCAALDVKDFDGLCDLIVLEQFKNTLPENIANYITDRKVETAAEAAALADEYVLTHKRSYGERRSFGQQRAGYDGGDGARVKKEFAGSSGTAVAPEAKSEHGTREEKICNFCHKKGHWKNDCYALKSKTKSTSHPAKGAAMAVPASSLGEVQVKGSCQSLDVEESYRPFVSEGFVSLVGSNIKVPVKILRDTAAFDTFIEASVLPFTRESTTGSSIPVLGMGLTVLHVPVHNVMLYSNFFQGLTGVAVRPALPVAGVNVILGNGLAGARVWADVPPLLVVDSVPLVRSQPDESETEFPEVFTACAVTRAMTRAKSETNASELGKSKNFGSGPMFSMSDFPLSVSQDDLKVEQQADLSLKSLFDQVIPEAEMESNARGYFLQDGLLVRKWVPHGEGFVGDPILQIVLPAKLRESVLKLAHEGSGHLGVQKTYDRVLRHFFWPRLKRDVAAHVKTCHTCQLTSKPNQILKPAPLSPIPAISQPFEHLIIDCVGPLPRSKSGAIYLLTVMCQSTRYPAAYPLRTITARSVVRALSQFISIFGIPKVIQSDQGSNFSSHLFSQVLKQLNVKHNQASAYHAQSQGALERFHQTLKSLLRAYCTQMEGDWEEGLPWLMLSAREVTQESTGFSPNDLVFGHTVRGPLSMLSDQWKMVEAPRNLLNYVNGFRHRLYAAGELAKEKMECAQGKMKKLYDRRTEQRVFSPGDRVLALLPITGSPFQAKFKGPYTVVKKISDLNYLISTPQRRKSTQLCHVNLLKPYHARASESPEDVHAACLATRASVITSPRSVEDGEEDGLPPVDPALLQGRLKNSETLCNLNTLLDHLPEKDGGDLVEVIQAFPCLFNDTPSQTHLIEHDIEVEGALPIRQRFYRVNTEKLKHLDAEVKYMLDNGIAEPSASSWASPCLLVPKSDKTFRFCTDFRKVNAVTKPDSFPLPRMEDCVDEIGHAKYVSKFDLLKGYWQVPLSKRAQEISAFITPKGLFSYKVMPFGLRNAPATFQRLMTRVLGDLEGCTVYLDDVVVFSDSWSQHVERIRALFGRLAEAGLTVNLAKCEFARATVTYLGRVVGQGQVRPVVAKVSAVSQYPAPTTKKELLRFLGLVGYYRCFCRNFSTVVTPLTNLLKSSVEFIWSDECQKAFESVKALLCTAPVLAAPRFDRPFTLQVDASHVGAGGVLLQADDLGIGKPVSFFSRKFNSYQLNYSTIEKEALALIWALKHFDVYVVSGAAPVVVYTDHNPLTFLNSLQCPNQRLIRWSLMLQSYWLEIRYIKGVENVVADALSRVP